MPPILTREERTLKSVWTNWDNDEGVFALLDSHPFTFHDLLHLDGLDLEYYLFRSGNKQCTTPLLNLVDAEGHLSLDNRQRIVTAIYLRYRDKWERAFQAFYNEYTPFTTYSDTESVNTLGTHDESGQRSNTRVTSGSDSRNVQNLGVSSGLGTSTTSDSGADTRTRSGDNSETVSKAGAESRSTTSTGQDDSNNGVFGFNSETAVKSSEAQGKSANVSTELVSFDDRKDATDRESGETETYLHGKSTDTKETDTTTETTEGVQSGNHSETGTEESSDTRNYQSSRVKTAERSGFTGNIADLAKKYLELWEHDFYEIIYKDVDSFLTLSVW